MQNCLEQQLATGAKFWNSPQTLATPEAGDNHSVPGVHSSHLRKDLLYCFAWPKNTGSNLWGIQVRTIAGSFWIMVRDLLKSDTGPTNRVFMAFCGLLSEKCIIDVCIYIIMYVYIYIYTWYKYIMICIYICIYIYTYIYIYICTYMYIHVCIFIHMYICSVSVSI